MLVEGFDEGRDVELHDADAKPRNTAQRADREPSGRGLEVTGGECKSHACKAGRWLNGESHQNAVVLLNWVF